MRIHYENINEEISCFALVHFKYTKMKKTRTEKKSKRERKNTELSSNSTG